MSQVKIQGNASGTGIFTIASPNSNTNRDLTLPDQTGTVVASDASGNVAVSGSIQASTSGVKLSGYDVIGGGSSQYLSLYANSGGPYVVVRGASNGSQGIEFGTGGSERARIDSSGNLLVGGTGVIVYSKVLSQFDGASKYGFVANDTSNAASVGFAAFAVNGTSTSGAIGSITRNGSSSAVLYNTTSDQRLKENIADADTALSTVAAIKVRKYDWKEGGQHEDYGFIAQELAEVVNNVVSKGRTEDDMWAVDYGKLTPLLCKAIQEQQALINDLTARIAALEAK